MGVDDQVICEKSIKFVENFFKSYLEDHDFAWIASVLDEHISWFGIGIHEICKNRADALIQIRAEKNSWHGHFEILNHWYQAVPVDDAFCLVFGELRIVEDGANTFIMQMDYRFSMLCHVQGDEIKLYHCHFSVPNLMQADRKFVHKTLVKDYNQALEETLAKRTQMLQAKTVELENLMGNIIGGVAICDYDRYYTINYINDGFMHLTGYTKDEIHELLNDKHLALVVPEDLPQLQADLDYQLKNSGNFTTEYRLQTKDGRIIWVLDKGAFIPSVDDQPKIQRILIDITAKKEQEEALMISDKRYEIAMALTDVTIFDFNMLTKEMFFHRTDIEEYGFPPMMTNAVETLIQSGIILPNSITDFREMYEAIYQGAPSSKAVIHTRGIDGKETILQINLVTIFDHNNKPVRAIGVKKDMTRTFFLEKEKEYGSTLASNKLLAYEANLTTGSVVSYNPDWVNGLNKMELSNYDTLIRTICENVVIEEDQSLFSSQLAPETLIHAFEEGKRLISFEFRGLLNRINQVHWFEQTLNIIKDEVTDQYNIRCYVADINEQKEKESRANEEQKIYETMMSTATMIYELNYTKNLFLSGHENWQELFNITPTTNYTDMLLAFCQNAIHPDDRREFMTLHQRQAILNAYESGQREIICEYRRFDHGDSFVWMRCVTHLFQDLASGDTKGFAFIENIDLEKKKELELIYKSEHDLLTGFYHKTSAKNFVDDYLASSDPKLAKHAFLMIDIDYFKLINDNFGHVFGDAILSKVSSKIHDLFRDVDILGRIGGDEFIVLMKNIQNSKSALSKAREICQNIAETYAQSNANYTISASIGIAFYPEHGITYDELYQHSDNALYISKRNGRNQFTLYSDNMINVTTEPKEIVQSELVESKTFQNHVSEYVFRILYEASEKKAAIRSVLELLGKHYDISRAYIFEDEEGGQYTKNTFEWCRNGVASQLANLQHVAYSDLGKYRQDFGEDNILFVLDADQNADLMRTLLAPPEIKSTLQFAIMHHGHLSGFIGFDQCAFEQPLSKTAISDLHSIAGILSVFITEMRAIEQSNKMKNMVMTIIDNLASFAYVCDPKTYRLLFVNAKTSRAIPDARIGALCYQVFWDGDQPCRQCPMDALFHSNVSSYNMELIGSKMGKYVRATATVIDWENNCKACLIDSVDISNYKA